MSKLYSISRGVLHVLFLLLITAILISQSGCPSHAVQDQTVSSAPQAPQAPQESQATQATQTFTLAELEKYDGKEGRKAYVAVDGVVYDVTGSKYWPKGSHRMCSKGAAAGKDLTETLKVSPPAMKTLIVKQPVVGALKK
ncbi:MAG: cytochrome b5 domain-containing protein [Candidatus Eremiobacteraeota bacterium]|nr:cytochrome b5 domain-containing protein [Candidatus Eremiobacteraeota bacterium]